MDGMLKTLTNTKTIEDLKQLDEVGLKALAKDIRKFLIQSIARTGGHLASNLGVVELSIALHYVFDSPQDQFVWDVGHQAYVHKIITGRRSGFKNLRKLNGMSGFPKRNESEHDHFETGHSSTSISAALGMAVARDLRGDDNHVLAIIGDGALTGGMAYEALNNAGRSNTKMIVILNDNEMSISENVGGMTHYLNHLRSHKEYIRAKADVEDILHSVPVVGDKLVDTVRRTKDSVKSFFIEHTLFEELGFTYLGPINGHDFNELIEILENAKAIEGPVLIHVKTKKGKGYKLAEQNSSAYHGVGAFDVKEGVQPKLGAAPTFSSSFGDAMVKVASEDEKLVAITAAMCEGTGLGEFAKTYPKRFFDVGIAEQHAVTFAAGLACGGYKPVIAVYSSFLQRAYDQILHDVTLQNLPVVFGIDRAGLVGEDGATHQGIFDIAYLSHMPNMTLLSVKMPEEMEAALRYAISLNAPVAIRYPRGGMTMDVKYAIDYTSVGFKEHENGNNVAILATGKTVSWAFAIREAFKELGQEVAVIEAPCIWPLDEAGLDQIVGDYDILFTLEDHVLPGGFGEKVTHYLKVNDKAIDVYNFAYTSGIVEHGHIEGVLEKEELSINHLTQKMMARIEK